MRSLRTLVLAPIVLVACGGPPPEPPKAPTPKPTAEVVKAPPPPDTSPVPEPAGLIVRGRFGKPEDTAKHAAMLSGMPVPSAAEMVAFATNDELGKAVDMEKTVDFAVAFAGAGRMPKPVMAISIPLKSFDDAKEKLGKYKLIPSDNGALRVEGILPPEEEGAEPHTCVLAPAAGPATARLVCGEVAGVETLAPYLTRTFSRDPVVTGDVHVEVLTGRAREGIEGVRRLLPKLAQNELGSGLRKKPGVTELVETFVGDATDFATDSDKITLDIETKGDGARAQLRVHFKSTNATATKLALGQGFPAAPPASVSRLPADTAFGLWSTGTPTALIEHFQGVAKRAMADIMLDAPGLTEKERADIPRLAFDKLAPMFDSAWSYGGGFDAESVTKAEDAVRTADDKTRREKEMNAELAKLGFHLVHLTRPFAQVSENTKSFGGLVGTLVAKSQDKSPSGWKMSWKPGPAPRGLPAGTLHYVLAREYTPPKDVKEPKRKASCHLYVTKDGEGSAAGFGCDEKVLTAKLAASLSNAVKQPGLPTEVLQANGHRGAFLTPRGIGWMVAMGRGIRRTSLGGAGSADTKVPIRITLKNEAPSLSGPAGTALVTIDAPKQAIGGIVATALRGAR